MTIHLYASTIRLFRYKNIGSNRHKEWRLEMFLPIIANITFVIILRYCSSIWITILVRIPYAQTRNWWHPWIVPDSMFTSESNANPFSRRDRAKRKLKNLMTSHGSRDYNVHLFDYVRFHQCSMLELQENDNRYRSARGVLFCCESSLFSERWKRNRFLRVYLDCRDPNEK